MGGRARSGGHNGWPRWMEGTMRVTRWEGHDGGRPVGSWQERFEQELQGLYTQARDKGVSCEAWNGPIGE